MTDKTPEPDIRWGPTLAIAVILIALAGIATKAMAGDVNRSAGWDVTCAGFGGCSGAFPSVAAALVISVGLTIVVVLTASIIGRVRPVEEDSDP
jgi:hypothetical protein